MDQVIKQALEEDIGDGDLTTSQTIPPDKMITAEIIAKEKGIICGLDLAQDVFLSFDKGIKFKKLAEDGDSVDSSQVVAEIKGVARSILTCERTALNFMQRLSGISTLTHEFVEKVRDTDVKILDTRKTTPGLRELEKYAVRTGGGANHRMNLAEMIMIKDNHIKAAGSINKALENVRKGTKVEVEIKNLNQIAEALDDKVDIILLDNMTLEDINKAVKLIRKRKLIEVSGNVNLKTVLQTAETGVDFISVGALTHSSKSLDISLNVL